MTDQMDIHSPAAAFARQARTEAVVEAALRWAMSLFLTDVERLATRDRLFLNAGDVTAAWADRMNSTILATRLPDDVAEYTAEVLAVAETPGEAYDTALTVLMASSTLAWSAQLTGDVLAEALSLDGVAATLTAAAPRRDSKRGRALSEAFDQALGGRDGMSWGDRAKRDARTAVTGLDGRRVLGELHSRGVGFKQWVSRHDERTRPTHAAADGQRVRAGEPFSVGGEPLMYPGDRSGSAGETVNCRCVIVAASRPAAGSTSLLFISP